MGDVEAWFLRWRAAGRPKPVLWHERGLWWCSHLAHRKACLGIGHTPLRAWQSWVRLGVLCDPTFTPALRSPASAQAL